MKVNANWHYREHSWCVIVLLVDKDFAFDVYVYYRPHISDSGSCDISVSSVSLSMGVVVGVDDKGHPTLKASGCSLSIGHLDITFHGGAR